MSELHLERLPQEVLNPVCRTMLEQADLGALWLEGHPSGELAALANACLGYDGKQITVVRFVTFLLFGGKSPSLEDLLQLPTPQLEKVAALLSISTEPMENIKLWLRSNGFVDESEP